ncbi:MAG: hypothetical protein ACOYD4_15050 [Solirubrobacterales bacterium]
MWAALARLDRALNRFSNLDRSQLAPLEAELGKSPQTQQVAALIARARALLRQARNGATAARGSGASWLSQHGSGEPGGLRGGGWATADEQPLDAAGSGSFGSAALEAVWAAGIDTPGGRAYFAAGEPAHLSAAAALPSFSGEYTFDAHGRSDRVEFGDTALSAAEVAALIRADSRWEGRPIRLFSCNTGRGDNPIAAELARLTGVRVTAPDDLVWSYPGGEVVVAPIKTTIIDGELFEGPDRDAEGNWREFDP